MVRVPSNSNLTPGGMKEFPTGVARGQLEMRRSGQISGVRQGSRRWRSESGGLFAAVRS
jgi:hypothetical protein